MAENVVKNKIVIEGEAKYKQTLREISQQLREAKSEVKAASAEMKANGQTAESARAKLDALGNVYKAQTEQLAKMQEHLGKVADAYGENSREASELRTRINNLRAETAGTSSQMQDLQRQLDGAGDAAQGMKDDISGLDSDLDKMGDAAGDAAGELEGLPDILSGLGQGIELGLGVSIGKDMLDGITGAIKQAAMAGFQEAVEDRKGVNLVGIQTGTLGTEYNDMMYEAMEKLTLRQPKVSTEDASGFAASIWTRAAGTDYVKDAQSLYDIMQATYTATQQTGIGFDEIAEGAKNMAAVFGSDFKDNVQVIASIGQSNAGAKGVDTIEKYGQSFVALGMGVEEAAGAVTHASDAGIDDVGKYGKAVESLATWMRDLTGETEGVKELGLLGDDLGKKFDEGGETAAKAVDLVIEKLKGIEDANLQNELGEKIFGSQSWDRYGMNVADAILSGYGQEFLEQAREQNQKATEALTDDLESQTAIFKNAMTETMGEASRPLTDAATEVVKAAAGAAIETLESEGHHSGADVLLAGITAGAGEAGNQWKQLWDGAAEESRSAMNEAFGENWAAAGNPVELLRMSSDENVQAVVDHLFPDEEAITDKAAEMRQQIADAFAGGDGELGNELMARYQTMFGEFPDIFGEMAESAVPAAEEAGKQMGESLETGTQESLDAVVDKIANLKNLIQAAYDAGDPGLAESVKTERDAAIQEMNELQSKLQEEAKTAGGNVETGFSTGAANVEVTVGDTATGMVTKLESKAQSFLDQGTAFGANLDEGFLAGAEPTEGDAESTVDSVIGSLEGGISRAYNAGHATGAAYNRGYKAALDQHSPSRVMRAAAEDTISPIIDTMEDGEGEIEARAAALGEAVIGGYQEGTGNGSVLASGGFTAGGGTVDPAALADAVRAGLGGLAVMIDGQLAGYLLEPDVSRATSERAIGTVKGQSAGARSW